MTPRIDGERLWATIMASAEIGATPGGGLNRLTLTDLDATMRKKFVGWCEEAGCTVEIDRLGNMFARRPGRDAQSAPVAVMSHLDSQPMGGRFDGVAGVMAGLEIIRALNDAGIVTERPIDLVNWTNEEGARFQPAMLGSGVFGGAFTLEEALASKDRAGVSVDQELQRLDLAGPLPVGARPFHAAFELHIEQGPVLEEANEDVAIVTGVQGMRWYHVRVRGSEAHCGATPMALRADAMRASAAIMTAAYRTAEQRQPPGVATVGFMEIRPNSPSIVPGEVLFSVDLSHPDKVALDAMEADLCRAVAEAGPGPVTATCDTIWDSPAVAFDPACVAALSDAAERCGCKWRTMLSGAGHDSVYVARVAPTAMLFIPCHKGISHNEAESIEPHHASVGAEVLLSAVLTAAGQA